MGNFVLTLTTCRCVADNEIGKTFSGVAILASLLPVFSEPAFRYTNTSMNTSDRMALKC